MYYFLLTFLCLISKSKQFTGMQITEFKVNMGAVGSDDDIRIATCDTSKCCTTEVLYNLFSGEWRANKSETWKGDKLGNCSEIIFDADSSRLNVSIVRLGDRPGPAVASLLVIGQTLGNLSDTKQFQCGAYNLGASDSVQSVLCSKVASVSEISQPRADSAMTISQIDVQMGSQGTDEDMRVKICDNKSCCTTGVLYNFLR